MSYAVQVHDLGSLQPIPLSLPFQELAPVTTACLVASPTDAFGHGSEDHAPRDLHVLTLDRLRVRRPSASHLTTQMALN